MSSSLFLTHIPLEIRNRIYHFLLVRDRSEAIYPESLCDRREEKAKLESIQVCRQIYTEALPIYLADNTFVFPLTFGDKITAFLLNYSANVRFLRSVAVEEEYGRAGGCRCTKDECCWRIEINFKERRAFFHSRKSGTCDPTYPAVVDPMFNVRARYLSEWIAGMDFTSREDVEECVERLCWEPTDYEVWVAMGRRGGHDSV